MDDHDLDRLLQEADAVPTVRATTLAELTEATRVAALREAATRARRRRLAVVGTAAGGALLLAAAASTAYWTKQAPFQSVPADTYRTHHAIPVDFTTTDGRAVRCELFPEFLHLSVAQSHDAERFVEGHDWSALGQQVYDTSVAPATDPDTIQRGLSDPLTERVRSVALQDMPFLAASPIPAEGGPAVDGPAWSGWGMSCGDGFR